MNKNKKRYITAKELSLILDVSKAFVYLTMYPEKKFEIALSKAKKENREMNIKDIDDYKEKHEIEFIKDNKNVLIDIDQFLDNHKVFDFKFINELEGVSFLERLKVFKTCNINDFPSLLKTSQVFEIADISRYELNKLRSNNLIKYKIVENPNYPKTSKGYIQYLYDRDSIVRYCNANNIDICKKEPVYCFSKQFYNIHEVIDYIESKYEKKISKNTVYRRISDTHEIPAIRVGTTIRIPIIEFEMLDHRKIFNIF